MTSKNWEEFLINIMAKKEIFRCFNIGKKLSILFYCNPELVEVNWGLCGNKSKHLELKYGKNALLILLSLIYIKLESSLLTV